MQSWKLQAILSAVFAGLTAVLAKFGMERVSADCALAVRTGFVFLFVAGNVLIFQRSAGFATLDRRAAGWLFVSALATALSWVFYYRAVKNGPVSQVALLDKGSILITLLAAFLILREPFTPRVLMAAGLILAGVLVLTLGR